MGMKMRGITGAVLGALGMSATGIGLYVQDVLEINEKANVYDNLTTLSINRRFAVAGQGMLAVDTDSYRCFVDAPRGPVTSYVMMTCRPR